MGLAISAHAAEAQAGAQVLVKAPVERVWQLLTDVDRWPSWNHNVETANLQGGVVPGSIFVWKSQGFMVTSTIQTIEPNHRLTWTGAAFGTRAFHSWKLEAVDGGVLVTTNETFDGWLPWLLHGTMQQKLEDTLPRWLASLKTAAERPATPVDVPSTRGQ
jgi:uncharacterized protein YndB with AHSA1/START domain